jgi:hypothetical protein
MKGLKLPQMKGFKLPQVHPAVNLAGFLTTVGLGIVTFVVNNQNAIVGAFPAKDAAFVALIISSLATLLPDKRQPLPPDEQNPKAS